jgi:hypothetical protein
MNQLYVVATDISGFFLYEPEALQHRATSPWCWFADYHGELGDMGSLTVPERCDGRLAMVHAAMAYVDGDTPGTRLQELGCDGLWAIRCTTEGLRPAEAVAEYVEARETCEVLVTQERLLLDGGYVIPHEAAWPLDEALTHRLAAWLTLPNGRYTVTTHVLRDHCYPEDYEAEGDLANERLAGYLVVTFQRRV